ncbi:hypothetical protein DMENIID0001_119960 [Sergentomyia squamirostris]
MSLVSLNTMNCAVVKDNPYYFNNVGECSKSPTQSSPARSPFSFFRKRNSTTKLNSGSPSKGKVFPSPSSASDTVSLGGGSRRGSLKSLIRSRSSTTSSVTYSQGIIMGECRPYSAQGTTHFRTRLGSYNESISYSGSDDVFDVDHRPNNFHTIDFHIPRVVGDCVTDGSSSSGPRRHSIGTFPQKERQRCSSFSDEVPKMPAPKPPTSSQQGPSTSSSLRKGKCLFHNFLSLCYHSQFTARHSLKKQIDDNQPSHGGVCFLLDKNSLKLLMSFFLLIKICATNFYVSHRKKHKTTEINFVVL